MIRRDAWTVDIAGGRRQPPARPHVRFARRARTFLKRLAGQECWHRVQVQCRREFLGSEYGGWWVCNDGLSERSIVYSFGVGEDISFDLSLIQEFGLEVFAFDPTPRVVEWVVRQKLPARFTFTPYGLAGTDGTRHFFPPANAADVSHSIVPRPGTAFEPSVIQVRRLATILREFGHNRLDLLKIDIEGAEYEVIDDIMDSTVRPEQLLIEFHHGPAYGSLTLEHKKRAVENLLASGYRIAAISDIGMEYLFIRGRSEPALIDSGRSWITRR